MAKTSTRQGRAQEHWIGRVTAKALLLSLSGLALIACTSSNGSDAIHATSSPLIENTLSAVACIGKDHCVAVGSIRTRSHADMYQTLIEENNGNGWVIVPSPNAGQYQSNTLSGVACATVRRCVAVGSTEGIECVSDTDCRGVGSGESTTLVEENTGHGWQIALSPNAGNFNGGTLSSVACPAVNHCIAVGSYDAGGIPQTLIEENTGRDWLIVRSPDPLCENNTACDSRLYGVACASTTHCIAVGSIGVDSTFNRGEHRPWLGDRAQLKHNARLPPPLWL